MYLSSTHPHTHNSNIYLKVFEQYLMPLPGGRHHLVEDLTLVYQDQTGNTETSSTTEGSATNINDFNLDGVGWAKEPNPKVR